MGKKSRKAKGKANRKPGAAPRVDSLFNGGGEIRLNGGKEPRGGLEVHVEGDRRVYRIPTVSDMTIADVMTFQKVNRLPKKRRNDAYAAAFYDLCVRYVPQAAIDSLTMDEFAKLTEAWDEANADGGMRSGE